MKILALDLGHAMGWAEGEAGSPPNSGSAKVDLGDLLAFVNKYIKRQWPRLVVVEDVLPLKGYARLGTAEHSVYDALRRQGVVMGCCMLWGVEFRAVDVRAVRKHFTGKVSHGSQADGKRATVVRCRQLDYVPADCADEDRCDALATWNFASEAICRKSPKILAMFGGHE